MAGRAGLRGVALVLLAGAMTASPGIAREPPAADPEFVSGRAGLLCVWAVNASMAEVGRRCGTARNARLQAALERSVSRLEAYARRRSPAGSALMTEYRARQIVGDAQLCHADSLDFYAQMPAPERLSRETDRLLASSPPVEWGACL